MAKKISLDQLEKITARFRTGVASQDDVPKKHAADPKKKGVPQVGSVIANQDPNLALNVIKTPKKATIILTPFFSEDPSKGAMFERFAKRAVRDSMNRNEAPLASHLFYYEIFNNNIQIERDMGLHSQISWIPNCDLVAVYIDFGVTQAMRVAIDVARLRGKKIEYRNITSFA